MGSLSGLQPLLGASCPSTLGRFEHIQREDTNLQHTWKLAKAPERDREQRSWFLVQNNLLYCLEVGPGGNIHLAPNVGTSPPPHYAVSPGLSLARYQRVEKTFSRILQHFHWPGMQTQVQHYCRACSECQLTQLKGAPGGGGGGLQNMPFVSVLFE